MSIFDIDELKTRLFSLVLQLIPLKKSHFKSVNFSGKNSRPEFFCTFGALISRDMNNRKEFANFKWGFCLPAFISADKRGLPLPASIKNRK